MARADSGDPHDTRIDLCLHPHTTSDDLISSNRTLSVSTSLHQPQTGRGHDEISDPGQNGEAANDKNSLLSKWPTNLVLLDRIHDHTFLFRIIF